MVSSGGDAGLQPRAPEAHGAPIAYLINESCLLFVILKIMGRATGLPCSIIYRKLLAESNRCFHQKIH